MLELADISQDDVVYDLGSGDGRIVLAAAERYGSRGVGIEIDADLVKKARMKARHLGVHDRVTFRQEDLFQVDLGEATVVMLYLWPDMNNRLRSKLQNQLDPGDRVVSHSFDIDGWEADTTVKIETRSPKGGVKTLFRWTIPDSAGMQ
jgi:tRNA A58 N-methylase Trm61